MPKEVLIRREGEQLYVQVTLEENGEVLELEWPVHDWRCAIRHLELMLTNDNKTKKEKA
jgi:hypothetical protein